MSELDVESRVKWSERPIFDTIAAAGLAVAHGLLFVRWVDPWEAIKPAERYGMFSMGGNIVAIVAGLAALGITVGGLGDRGRQLRSLYGPELRRNRRSLLVMGALASACCLVAYGAEANGKEWAPYLFEFAVVWTVVRLLRLVWLVDALAALDDKDVADPGRHAAMPLAPEFRTRFSDRAS